ncbi:hypothetical protein ALC60_03575 [Trachymyrmex zeteki]|uniref:Uncharacterized protein n=1 Tax=Mycetomoellerius zeteki TaxID=64791 RepID=A0A151XB49_9HYME|nr:hypothetical protein ALC60_03575 [Trachymyrmex zeteki]
MPNPPPPTLGRHISTVTSVIRSKEPRRPAGTARQMLLHTGRRGELPRVTRERESERKTVTVTVTPSVAYITGKRPKRRLTYLIWSETPGSCTCSHIAHRSKLMFNQPPPSPPPLLPTISIQNSPHKTEHRADTMAKSLRMERNGTSTRRILYCLQTGQQCHASYRILIARVTRSVPIYRDALWRWKTDHLSTVVYRTTYMSRIDGFIRREILADWFSARRICHLAAFQSLPRVDRIDSDIYSNVCSQCVKSCLNGCRRLSPVLLRIVSDADGVRVGSSVIRLADEERLGTDVGYPYQEWCQCSLLCSLCYARLGPAPRRSSDGYRTLSSYSSPCLLGTPS